MPEFDKVVEKLKIMEDDRKRREEFKYNIIRHRYDSPDEKAKDKMVDIDDEKNESWDMSYPANILQT